jgi:Asp-tRNA(Asn)/Glu-tRNA(Gln) amidotransferase B subunit
MLLYGYQISHCKLSTIKQGETELETYTGLKKINPFHFVEGAINYEVECKIDVIKNGDTIVQETRLCYSNLFNLEKRNYV